MRFVSSNKMAIETQTGIIFKNITKTDDNIKI